jgi:5-methylcytosine-specific restriction endonuclease McrA
MAKKRPPFNQNAAIRSAIRRVFSRSPIVREMMSAVRREVPKFNKDGSRAKKDAVQYQCNVCKTWTKSTAIAVDHKNPVIDVEDGFVDWNTFVDRLFCGPENLQVVCDTCHQEKTNKERFDRSFIKDQEILKNIERVAPDWDIEFVTKFAKKFTASKLSLYPKDFTDRIIRLKEQLRGRNRKSK